MAGASFSAQANALLRKSATYQKRNVGSNCCLLTAPIFFCILLALIQVLVNRVFLSGDSFKCGCKCTKCCPSWALQPQAGVWSADGTGKVTVLDPVAFGDRVLEFSPSQISYNAAGQMVIYTCAVQNNGPCPTDDGYSCLATDKSACSIQFSTPAQSTYCRVQLPSSWPAVMQVPDIDRRAKPWGNFTINGVEYNQDPVMVTGANSGLASTLGRLMFADEISRDSVLWAIKLAQLYTGNETVGNVFNGDALSTLGFKFGTNSAPQVNLYIERAFQQGQELYMLLPNTTCSSRGIATGTSVCLSRLLTMLISNSTLTAALPPCGNSTNTGSTNTSVLLSATSLRVRCVENAVIGSASAAEMEDQLYCGFWQSRCYTNNNTINNQYSASWDLLDTNDSRLAMDVYYNLTFALEAQSRSGAGRTLRLPSVITRAVEAWVEHYFGSANAKAVRMLGVMSMPKDSSELNLDFSSLLGPLFYSWVVQLLLPTFLQQLVYEKEKRLRMMMKMHGLGDGAYWLITYLWYLALYAVYIIIFTVFGSIVQLKVFRKTATGIQALFYFLFGNNMIAFAFMLSSLFSSARTAVVVAFLYVFASGLIGELLLKTFMDDDKSWLLYLEWVPAWSLYRGLYEQAQYTFLGVYKNEKGMQSANLKDPGNGMSTTYAIFVVEWFIFMLLGWYLEQVVSSGTGIRRHPLFFLEWMWAKKDNQGSFGPRSHEHAINVKAQGGELEDVEAERRRVEALESYDNQPIVVKDLRKIYPGQDGGKPKLAVRNLTLGIERGECFGLLGPNGAGKTTAISMLVGFLEPSGGTGIIEGYDILHDMQHVYRLMGVCPQHDLLWDQLSGREHLLFYGRLKGLRGAQLEDSVNAALKSVNLYNAKVGEKLSSKYSGGMKRRLSVAISFMGDPRVVYLDEPSTGLDPASRRNLWDVVKGSKAGRAIILTTHSMEEAEMLCDRLGIFVDGQLVCIGNPKEITSRYAGYLVFTITVSPDQEAAARDLVVRMSPSATLTYALGGTLKYELPTREVSLSKVFQVMNDAKASLNVLDWGVANATLEEVFIKFARSIGAKTQDN